MRKHCPTFPIKENKILKYCLVWAKGTLSWCLANYLTERDYQDKTIFEVLNVAGIENFTGSWTKAEITMEKPWRLVCGGWERDVQTVGWRLWPSRREPRSHDQFRGCVWAGHWGHVSSNARRGPYLGLGDGPSWFLVENPSPLKQDSSHRGKTGWGTGSSFFGRGNRIPSLTTAR